RRRQVGFLSDERSKSRRVELRAKTDHAVGREFEVIDREASQEIDRIRDDEQDRIVANRRALKRIENLLEQLDIAIDQIETTLIRFASQPGRDAYEIGRCAVVVIAGVNSLIARDARAMKQIERFAACGVGIRIEQVNLVDDPSALESEGSIAA